MLAKDKFLKKNKIYIFVFFLLIFFAKTQMLYAAEYDINKINEHLNSLEFFSANFIQSNDGTIQEGTIHLGEKRLKIKYFSPSNITFVMSEKKAMYVNYDLYEVEYFNPLKTPGGVLFEIFKNNLFLSNSKIVKKEKTLILNKDGFVGEDKYVINIFFEKSPYLLRKIKLEYGGKQYTITFVNHQYNVTFRDNFFSMVNPLIVN
ncbi:MAG: hypothetical protein CMI96_00615 [Pelagibacteraceae bacterium]|nr:hypothetical protein [Pelagibacteraceae bacterium]|tara:strand:- start:61534 stop:62145 length:612 start_codon:yes stop_codon:yes gene_type:complete